MASGSIKVHEDITNLNVTVNSNITVAQSSFIRMGKLYKFCAQFTPSANIAAFTSLFEIGEIIGRYAATALYNRTDNNTSGLIYMQVNSRAIQCAGGLSKDKQYVFELII